MLAMWVRLVVAVPSRHGPRPGSEESLVQDGGPVLVLVVELVADVLRGVSSVRALSVLLERGVAECQLKLLPLRLCVRGGEGVGASLAEAAAAARCRSWASSAAGVLVVDQHSRSVQPTNGIRSSVRLSDFVILG